LCTIFRDQPDARQYLWLRPKLLSTLAGDLSAAVPTAVMAPTAAARVEPETTINEEIFTPAQLHGDSSRRASS
jgi:hypothetical protein